MTIKDVLALALEALERAEKALSEAIMVAPITHLPPSAPAALQVAQTAITAIKQAQEPKVKLIPTAEEMGTPMQPQYSLDADPQGIRARVVSAVIGAMAYGARGENKPPEGHWLNEVWDIARAEAAQQAEPEATDFGHGYDVGYEAGRLHASAPEGYKLVPVEPTREMFYAIQNDCDILTQRAKRVWATMLAAAPTPPEAA